MRRVLEGRRGPQVRRANKAHPESLGRLVLKARQDLKEIRGLQGSQDRQGHRGKLDLQVLRENKARPELLVLPVRKVQLVRMV